MRSALAILFLSACAAMAVEADLVLHWNGTRGLITNAGVQLLSSATGTYDGWWQNGELPGTRFTIEARTNTMTFPVTVTVGGNAVDGSGTNWIRASMEPPYGSDNIRFVMPGGYNNPSVSNVLVGGFVTLAFDTDPPFGGTDLIWMIHNAGGKNGVLNTYGGWLLAHATSPGSSYGNAIPTAQNHQYYYTIVHRLGGKTTLRVFDPANGYALLGYSEATVGSPGNTWEIVFVAGYLRQPGGSVFWGPAFVIYDPSTADIAATEPLASGLTVVEVQAAIDAAGPLGSVVYLPAGTATWATNVVISRKAITLQGHASGTSITSSQAGNIGSGTNLGGAVAIKIMPTTNGLTRVTGVNFDCGTNLANFIYVGGGDKWGSARIDHCTFLRSGHGAVDFGDMVAGLVDHNTFRDGRSTVNTYALDRMNESWVDALTLGTTNAVCVETNQIHYDSVTVSAIGVTSQGLGGRSVWRFNTITNNTSVYMRFLDAHGNQYPVDVALQPDTSGITNSHRGTRQVELYNNTVVNTASPTLRMTDLRAGTLIINSNTFLGTGAETQFYAREEDAPYQNNFVSAYPGYDQHQLWAWGNTSRGTNVTSLGFANAQDGDYLVTGTNVFFSAHPSWTPLAYPHPIISGSIPVFEPSGSGMRGTGVIRGLGAIIR